jgi:hypothetical protein
MIFTRKNSQSEELGRLSITGKKLDDKNKNFDKTFVSHRGQLKPFYKNRKYKVITKEGSLVQNSSTDLMDRSPTSHRRVSTQIGSAKDSIDGSISPDQLPKLENAEWKLVKYIKIVPRKYKENFELKFKDSVATGNTLKKTLEDIETQKMEQFMRQ